MVDGERGEEVTFQNSTVTGLITLQNKRQTKRHPETDFTDQKTIRFVTH